MRAAQTLGAEVELGAVLRLEGEVAKCQRIESLLDEVGDAEEVSGRLRHSRAGQQQQPAVHPLADDAVPGDALRLRELCLVMRKDVVGATRADVEPRA